jgi:hypothetical protein
MLAHDVSDPGDDGLALGLREKVDFHLNALPYPKGLFQLQQRPAHTQVQNLPCAPFRLGNRADARRPSDVMPAGAACLDRGHGSRAQQDPRAARVRRDIR